MEPWIASDFGGVDASLISDFEKRNRIKLPPYYKKFLERHDGADVIGNTLRLSGELQNEGYSLSIRILRGIRKRDLLFDHLDGAIDCFSDTIPSSHLPIGYDWGGNQYTMKVRGLSKYKIYWWDLDTQSKVLVSSSFSDFVTQIEPQK